MASLMLYGAWQTEAFARTKGRLPSLKSLLKKSRTGTPSGIPRQTPEQQREFLLDFFEGRPGVKIERIPIEK